MAVAILLGLFAVQSRGTAQIAKAFGPVMLLWFLVIAALALQLPICFEVRALSGGLMSSTPE
jgi:K+ transporter